MWTFSNDCEKCKSRHNVDADDFFYDSPTLSLVFDIVSLFRPTSPSHSKKKPEKPLSNRRRRKKRYDMTRSLSDRVEGKLNYVCNIEWLNGTVNILFLIKSDFRSHFDFAVHLIAQRIHPIVSIPLIMCSMLAVMFRRSVWHSIVSFHLQISRTNITPNVWRQQQLVLNPTANTPRRVHRVKQMKKFVNWI